MESRSAPTLPLTSIWPTSNESFSVNHSVSPEGAAAIPAIPRFPSTGYSVITPAVVILPMCRPASVVNQRLPSGPTWMSHGSSCSASSGKSV